jgi:HSP20 family molecular chaperone IbpA
MSEVAIKTYQPFEKGPDRLLSHITSIVDQIKRRAFDLSTRHGQSGLNEVDDWLQAERELLACQRCEVREGANQFVAELDAEEFRPKDFELSLMGNDLMIEGTSSTEKTVEGKATENLGRSIMVRAFLPDAFDPATLKAELHDGVLRVTAEKRHPAAGSPAEQQKMAVAAA